MQANLKCPHCFSAKVKLCDGENKENVLCTKCDCRFEFNPELAERWK
jgi:transcription elongation factor Elf1